VHAQGIIHRDIKPDNCLITDDDALKIVDFGVSEMFEKDSDMNTAKSAGSPAFMPPELCVAKHGEVSGRACDIWSMGVTLYCLRFGRIPFEKTGMLDLYESIKHDDFSIGSNVGDDFLDLMKRVMEKDPDKRIRMEELREHPWVTKQGTDPLLPREENVANLIEPPTEEELNHAITGNVGRLLVVMKAVKRFKSLLVQRRPELMESIFGNSSRLVQPPLSINPLWRTHSSDLDDRKSTEQALVAEGIHREIKISDAFKKLPEKLNMVAIHGSDVATDENAKTSAAKEADLLRKSSPLPENIEDAKQVYKQSGKGQAHDPLEDTLYLGIGNGALDTIDSDSFAAVSESPSATDFNVYEKAYQEEIDRIVAKQGEDVSRCPTLFLTRRVEHIKDLHHNELLVDHIKNRVPEAANVAFRKLVDQAKANVESATTSLTTPSATGDPAQESAIKKVVEQAKENYEAASNKISMSASSTSQEDNTRSRFGFNRLVDKARHHIEAARTAKTDTSDAK
jgi:[calcium/calmodulin-dependent protein kinase] kinase